MSMRWKVLALLLRSRAKMRLMLTNMYKSREKMKLYCHLFPSDYEFDRDNLVQLWMAMGFSSRRCAEDFCKRYFDILLKEQHILFSRIDLLTGRKMYIVDQHKITPPLNGIQTIRNEDDVDDFILLEDENTCGPKSCHISLVANDNINQTTFEKLKSFGNELKSLLFIRKHGSSLKNLPSDLFLSFELLHALDLSGSQIIELPRSIGNVRQLRYIDLSFTLIESLPECIDRLHQLQTLKLGGCKHLFELPKGMKELICLRYLDFDVLGQLSFLPKGIGALTELQMLSAFIVDDSEEGCSIRELKTMNNLSGSFCISGLKNVSFDDFDEAGLQHKKYVTHLQVRWNELQIYSTEDQHNAYYIIDKLNLNENLTDLQITCFPGLTFSPWVKWREHGKLVSITLLKCENKDFALSLGLLPNLKYLNIIHMNRVRKIDVLFRGVCESNFAAFPKLEKLEIDCMYNVESWRDVFSNDFQLISKLIIKQCPKLVRLPFLPHLQSLKHLEISRCIAFECLPDGTLPTSLETLILNDCPLLNKRCLRECEDWHKIKHVPNIWVDLEDICSIQEDGADEENISSIIDEDVDEVHNMMKELQDIAEDIAPIKKEEDTAPIKKEDTAPSTKENSAPIKEDTAEDTVPIKKEEYAEDDNLSTASRDSRLQLGLHNTQIQSGYVQYPWERKMQMMLQAPNSSSLFSILFLPKASETGHGRYNDVEDSLARANAWLNASQASGVQIAFINIQTESLLAKISGETSSSTVCDSSLSDLPNHANASHYRFKDYHEVDTRVVRAIRLWYSPIHEYPVEINIEEGDMKLGFAISRTEEGFIHISSVLEGDEDVPSSRSGLCELYKNVTRDSKLLVISRVNNQKVLPWIVTPTSAIGCFDIISLSQKLSLYRHARVPLVVHVLMLDSRSGSPRQESGPILKAMPLGSHLQIPSYSDDDQNQPLFPSRESATPILNMFSYSMQTNLKKVLDFLINTENVLWV